MVRERRHHCCVIYHHYPSSRSLSHWRCAVSMQQYRWSSLASAAEGFIVDRRVSLIPIWMAVGWMAKRSRRIKLNVGLSLYLHISCRWVGLAAAEIPRLN